VKGNASYKYLLHVSSPDAFSSLILSSIPEGYFLLDNDGKVQDCNPKAEEMTGYRREELLGRNLERLGTNVVAKFESMLRGRSKGSGTISSESQKEIREMIEPDEMRFIKKDGESRVFQTSAAKVRLGKKERTVVIARDVTEQSEKIDGLSQAEKMYRRIFDISPDGIVVCDLKGTIIFVNQTFCRLTGYMKEDVIGRFWPTIPTVRSIDMPSYIKHFKDFLYGAASTDMEFVWKNKRNETRWGDAHIGLLDLENETHFLVILRDITKHKAQDLAIEKSELKNRTIVENLPDALVIHDLKGEIIEANQIAVRMFGFGEVSELMGKSLQSFSSEKARKSFLSSLKDAITLGMWGVDGEFVRKDRSTFQASVRSKLVSTTGNGVVQAVIREKI
jgi:PAS domain S-box-containing protein